MSKAQEALEAYGKAVGDTGIATAYVLHYPTIRSALTLMAALEAVPDGWSWNLSHTPHIKEHKYFFECPDSGIGYTGEGDSPTEAITAALSKLTNNGEKE